MRKTIKAAASVFAVLTVASVSVVPTFAATTDGASVASATEQSIQWNDEQVISAVQDYYRTTHGGRLYNVTFEVTTDWNGEKLAHGSDGTWFKVNSFTHDGRDSSGYDVKYAKYSDEELIAKVRALYNETHGGKSYNTLGFISDNWDGNKIVKIAFSEDGNALALYQINPYNAQITDITVQQETTAEESVQWNDEQVISAVQDYYRTTHGGRLYNVTFEVTTDWNGEKLAHGSDGTWFKVNPFTHDGKDSNGNDVKFAKYSDEELIAKVRTLYNETHGGKSYNTLGFIQKDWDGNMIVRIAFSEEGSTIAQYKINPFTAVIWDNFN